MWWTSYKGIGISALLFGPGATAVLAGLDLLDMDLGVFEALMGWTCWLLVIVADAVQDFVLVTFDQMPARGLISKPTAEIVWSWLKDANEYIPAIAGLAIFFAWGSAMLVVTVVRVIRFYVWPL